MINIIGITDSLRNLNILKFILHPAGKQDWNFLFIRREEVDKFFTVLYCRLMVMLYRFSGQVLLRLLGFR